jgi:hypothetical protein
MLRVCYAAAIIVMSAETETASQRSVDGLLCACLERTVCTSTYVRGTYLTSQISPSQTHLCPRRTWWDEAAVASTFPSLFCLVSYEPTIGLMVRSSRQLPRALIDLRHSVMVHKSSPFNQVQDTNRFSKHMTIKKVTEPSEKGM